MGNRHPPSNVLPEVHPKSVNSKIQGRDMGRHGLFFFNPQVLSWLQKVLNGKPSEFHFLFFFGGLANVFFLGGEKVVDIINRVKMLVFLLVAFSACKPSGGQKSATCLGFHGSCLATWGIHRAIHQRQRAKTSLQCPLCHLDQIK